MTTSLISNATIYLRQRMLGSEAVYRVIDEDGDTVTAEVVYAPGLEHGTTVRLLARAAAAMEQIEALPESITATRVVAAAA